MKSKFATPLILIILIGISCYTRAQEKPNQTSTVQSLNKFKLYLLGVGIEREQKISSSSSIYFGAAIESVVPFYPIQPLDDSDIVGITKSFNFAPVFSGGFKNYYDISKKAGDGKITANNSANFVGFEYNLIAPILINGRYVTRYFSSFSPTWGFQKNTLKNMNIEFVIGPSFQTDFDRSRISVLARIGLSYLL